MPAAKIFELVTPWAAADLAQMRYEQTADVAVISCYGYKPQRLRRFDHNDWRIDDAPIGSQITAPVGVSAAATSPSTGTEYVAQAYDYAVTAVNASGQESVASATVTASNDLSLKGNYNTISWTVQADAIEYRIYATRSGVYGFIGRAAAGVTSFKDDNILADFSNAPPTAFNPFSDGENPSVVAFHEGRLFFGRTPKRPSAIFGSRSDDIFNLDRASPAQPADSLALSLRGRKVNAIAHMIGFGGLIALTGDAIWSISPTSDGYLSPTSIQTKNEGYQGVGNARPAPIIDVLFYATKRGNQIRTLGYTFEKDGYRGNNLTVFAPHLFTSFTITHMVYAEVPSSILWCLRSDGKLAALTWQQEQDVWGWTLCDTDGLIESICVVGEPMRDSLYACVRREIGGETVRHIERMAEPKWIDQNWTDQDDCIVMDAAITYRGDPTRVIYRIEHLEGREVSVLADGLVKTGHTVVNGRLTPDLDAPYSTVTIGLPYLSYITTLPVVVQAQGRGTTKGQPQIVKNVIVELMNTRGVEIGIGTVRVPEGLYEIELPDYTNSSPPPLFTGTHEIEDFAPGDWTDAKVTIAQRLPLPMVVTGVFPDVAIGGS